MHKNTTIKESHTQKERIKIHIKGEIRTSICREINCALYIQLLVIISTERK